MTDKELITIKKQVCESLANDRHDLLVKFPFIGNLLMRMELVPVRDMRCPTACTDGKTVYFSIAFYEELNTKERIFVLAHEMAHCMLLHLVRCQHRDHELFNIASDMEVNYMLQQQSVNDDLIAPNNLCFPPKEMEGKSAEVIYDYLLKQVKKNKSVNSLMSSGEGSSSGSSGSSSNKSKSGKFKGQFDNHKYNDYDDEKSETNTGTKVDKNGKVTDRWGEVGFDKDYHPRISDDYAEEMREAVIAEIQRTERTQGTLPAGLSGLIKKLEKPEIDWRERLAQFVTVCYGDKRRWLPPNRRHVYDEIYMQSRRTEKIKICCLIDTSGSCWADQSKFFGELNGLLKTFSGYEMTVIQCDADVHSVDKYDDLNPFPIDNPAGIDIKGSGGSDFRPAFKYIRENSLEFDCMISMTDGYIDVPRNDPGYPVLWVLTKDCDKNFCDWGQKLIFKNSSYDL